MNSKELFSRALGLQSPWKLNDVDFAEEGGQKILRIDIGFEKGARFSDPVSGEGSRAGFMTSWNASGVT